MINIYGVMFQDNGKIYYFKSEKDFELNQGVIVETGKGMQYGKLASIIDDHKEINIEDIKDIVRLASDDDYEEYVKNLKDADAALNKCKKLVNELELKMNVISCSYTFDRTQLLFNFTSEERIDFRELAKKLAGIYHTRIELRQIGARDKAKEVGGVGVCGRELCCAKFLRHIDAVSMNMAKNQNLALNPSKINGSCGRLLCCLSYEDEQYIECSKGLPSYGQTINTKNGKGQVINVDILNRKVKVMVDGNKEEVEFNQNEKVSTK